MKSILIISVFLSALTTIWIRHQHRLTFIDLQTLEKKHDKLEHEWEQLQLEQSTWVQPQRIEQLAKEKLSMKIPNSEDIFFIKLPK